MWVYPAKWKKGLGKDMLPVDHLAPKILKIMVVNFCGRKLVRRLELAAPAYHKKDCATPHPGACSMTGGLMSALGCGFGCGIL